MRAISKLIVAAVGLVGVTGSAQAGLLGMPLNLRSAFQHIKLDAPALPPMAYSQFCIRYADDCQNHSIVFRGGPVKLTEERMDDLREVNATVNAAIAPEHNELGLAGETWLIGPARGDCNDYAVTKRHELLDRGWPARTLLLGEVVTSWGEHHLVLVVRARGGDLADAGREARARHARV